MLVKASQHTQPTIKLVETAIVLSVIALATGIATYYTSDISQTALYYASIATGIISAIMLLAAVYKIFRLFRD